jgi:hypothetical protein
MSLAHQLQQHYSCSTAAANLQWFNSFSSCLTSAATPQLFNICTSSAITVATLQLFIGCNSGTDDIWITNILWDTDTAVAEIRLGVGIQTAAGHRRHCSWESKKHKCDTDSIWGPDGLSNFKHNK